MHGKILVIDDEKSICFTFQRHLEREGHAVTTAENAVVAKEYLADTRYDLIFLDILLGEENGIELLREILHTRGVYCPVIMITGAPELESAAAAIRLGAHDYLSKPIDKMGLLRVTQQALKHKFFQDEKNRVAAENDQFRRHFEAIFRSIHEGIITVDRDMRVIESNEAARELLQIVSPSIAGRRLDGFLDKNHSVCCSVLRNTLKRRAPVQEYRVECRTAQQKHQVLMLNSAPLFDDTHVFVGAVLIVRDVSRLTELERELKGRHQFQNLIGKSAKMQRIYALLENLSGTQTSVLITGESGTGKELVAEALHYSAPGDARPLVKVNCSALAENLLESELFGHVRGAFTGAITEKIGRFQRADGGTIFLDEIGDISPVIQLKLLRVLQEKSFEKVGDATPIDVDVRIVAATNTCLREKIQRGEFREDLYYRLKVVEIELPPLRERRGDIQLLIEHFCGHFNKVFKKQIMEVSDDAMERLLAYQWPGNVRELEHVIEHAFVFCDGNCIATEHLSAEIREAGELRALLPIPSKEAETLRQTLEKTGWNKAKAARLLGINRRTIYRKMEKYGFSINTEV